MFRNLPDGQLSVPDQLHGFSHPDVREYVREILIQLLFQKPAQIKRADSGTFCCPFQRDVIHVIFFHEQYRLPDIIIDLSFSISTRRVQFFNILINPLFNLSAAVALMQSVQIRLCISGITHRIILSCLLIGKYRDHGFQDLNLRNLIDIRVLRYMLHQEFMNLLPARFYLTGLDVRKTHLRQRQERVLLMHVRIAVVVINTRPRPASHRNDTFGHSFHHFSAVEFAAADAEIKSKIPFLLQQSLNHSQYIIQPFFKLRLCQMVPGKKQKIKLILIFPYDRPTVPVQLVLYILCHVLLLFFPQKCPAWLVCRTCGCNASAIKRLIQRSKIQLQTFLIGFSEDE